jgi:hypothetical protein
MTPFFTIILLYFIHHCVNLAVYISIVKLLGDWTLLKYSMANKFMCKCN